MTPTRQLAAIMFTDIKGYTALMQQDERKALAARDKHRQIFNSVTQKHNGRILQYYGDGTLSIFDSAIDAVHCGIEMQQGFRQDPAIPVRIGIHTGDIFFSDEEIVGDSVNVASRIESLAVPGSVFISEKVFDEIKNQPTISATRLKAFKFKNIERPIEVYAVSNDGLVVPDPDELAGKTDPGAGAGKPGTNPPGLRPESVHLLATKLFSPPLRPKAIRRSRLTDRLNQGLHGKMTLISAPAGFGKTTLVSEWIAGCNRPVAWLSLDERDSDLTRFLTYLTAALQTVARDFGGSVSAMLQSPQPSPTESVLAVLLNEIAALPEPILLVLDDYHVLDSPPVDQALSFLLDHLPPQLHLVITTREDPPLPLARLRVRGQLTELRIADLRFTAPEAAGFLNDGMGLDLSEADITALETRTEGWAAGLQLAALSMQGRTDTAGFIRSFTGGHHFILDYLMEEVLQHQSGAMRSFLMQTALLERLCGPLCDAVTGRTDGRAILETLERGNLFVIPLDDSRQWYRYHHLFSEVLRAHTDEEHARRLPELHRRAAEWYARNGLTADAVRHALAAGNMEFAAGLIEQAWPEMDENFQAAAWLKWAQALPDDLVRNRPVLSVAYAWALLNNGVLEAARSRLQDAERVLRLAEDLREREMVVVDREQFRFLPGSIATAYAYTALAFGDVSATIEHARHALELLPDGDHLRRGPAASILGLAEWTNGRLEAAYQSLTDAMNNFQLTGNTVFALSGTYFLAGILITLGRLKAATKLYERSLQLALENGKPVRGTADLYLGMAELAFEHGDMTTAIRYLNKSEDLGEQAALPDWRCRLCQVKARFCEADGDVDGALKLLDKAEGLYYRTPIPDARPIPALKAGLCARSGRLQEALGWVDDSGLSAEDDLNYLNEFGHITLARVLIGRYRLDRTEEHLRKAEGLLNRLLTAAEAGARIGVVIRILILRALAYQAGGSVDPALISFGRALALAAPERFQRCFLEEGRPVLRLLTLASERGISLQFTRDLLGAFGQEADEPKREAAAHPLIEPLSERELEILRLIAQGLSNQAISERLFLALSTIKGHNQHIFEKLDVSRRTEAVARAQALGLL